MEFPQSALPNTDPMRFVDNYPDTLPPNACEPDPKSNYHHFIYYNIQYFLGPDLDPSLAGGYYDRAFHVLKLREN